MRHVQTTQESFKAWENGGPYLHNPWHYHPEYEITYIHRGEGILFIGDKIVKYRKGSLIMIGSNLPHEWRSDIRQEPDYYSRTFAIHFKRDFPGDAFYSIPEAAAINQLLQKSGRGIKINDETIKKAVKDKMLRLLGIRGIERINMLFSILNDIASCPKTELLSSSVFLSSIDEGQNQRMNQVYKYVTEHFRGEVSVEEIARQVCMTTTSFCRFFKKRTNKSLIQYVNEIRVGYACKLLMEESHTISQIAYESGFGNLSNFNKQFRKVKQMTPTQFMQQLSDDQNRKK